MHNELKTHTRLDELCNLHNVIFRLDVCWIFWGTHEFEDIKLNKQDKAATITVDRHKVYNAIRYETMLEIIQALDDIEVDKRKLR